MANSRKCKTEPGKTEPDSLTRALAGCLAQCGNVERLAVAISGGADSTLLAVHAAVLAQQRGLALHCFHIHHGLHPQASHWQAHVHDLALRLRIPCHSLRVTVTHNTGLGVEAAARTARYAGLAQLAHHVGVRHLLLGHHRDDQAETVLLRLLRGAGPQGLAAMQPISEQNGLTLLRPFLALDRQVLAHAFARWCRMHNWQAAQDPSNANTHYARAALRLHVVPALDQHWPAWRSTLARHAQLSAQTHAVLDDVASQDFASLSPSADNTGFSLARWRTLPPARQALVLRYWLALNGLQMPTAARLRDALRQLRGVHALGHDRSLHVRHGQASIVCERGKVKLLHGSDST